MSANIGSEGSGKPGSIGQDFDLNLAPIIDAFVVLIAFLLASASFLSIGILDAGVSGTGADEKKQKKPPVQITVELDQAHKIRIRVSGKENRTTTLAATGQGADQAWNHDALLAQLKTLKSRWSSVDAVTLTAGNEVAYADLIESMNKIRTLYPAVLLGGF